MWRRYLQAKKVRAVHLARAIVFNDYRAVRYRRRRQDKMEARESKFIYAVTLWIAAYFVIDAAGTSAEAQVADPTTSLRVLLQLYGTPKMPLQGHGHP
jgi:arginine decarboxylase-like protein